jgi:integrase
VVTACGLPGGRRVNLARHRRRLRQQQPKDGRGRDPLPESVKLELSTHLEQFPAALVTLPDRTTAGRVAAVRLFFTTSRGNAINGARFHEDTWNPARIKAGVPLAPEDGFHALRHRFASVLIAGQIDVPKVSEYLGHESAAFTYSTYAHLIPGGEDRMREVIDQAATDSSRTDAQVTRLRRRSAPWSPATIFR